MFLMVGQSLLWSDYILIFVKTADCRCKLSSGVVDSGGGIREF